ncbi:cysteine-rich CWC family protein [Paenibacillus glycinis]|uniref:Cysteine-rich CWC family protein n=1 Tax=Paenibacillus glycinis TaxID=2697035 RepID=A0ABW9XKW5_9BACL|nr:cysteine-rich CWC family protein [Paenibacillus glycinis]NBD23257.1 hypothetical protein [Paenibacillus glycinis]
MHDEAAQTDCPICGQTNACEGSHDCWCGKAYFPRELFELVPPELRGKACICRACLRKFVEADTRGSSR